MAKFSDTFTQGGQTQLHKLHMIRQVIGSTLKVTLVLFVLTYAAFIWYNHCWQDFWYILCWFKAWIRVDYLNMLPRGFFDESSLIGSDGIVHNVTDYALRHVEFYQNLKHSLLMRLLKEGFYSLLISSVGCLAVSWFWVKMGRKKQKTKILSGFECVLPKVLRKQVLKFGASPYTIADVPMPKNTEFQHMMVTGTTGAGKSNMIHQLLPQIRSNGDQAVIVDTTGGIFSRFYDIESDILLNPLDKRSNHWNMWSDVTSDYVVNEISEAIIPDGKSLDSFWTQGARQLFSECIKYLKRKDKCFYKQLIHMSVKMDLKTLHDKLRDTRIVSLLDPSIDKTALSVRASLSNHLEVFDLLKDDTNGISLLNFMKNNTKDWLFLSCPTDQRAFLKPIFSVWLSLAIKGMMTRAEHNESRTWIIIDELASLNKLPSLMTGLAEIRKYGGCFVLGFQDLSQVEEIYGHSCAKTLSNLTGTKVLFRAIDTDVASRVARYMGEQEKEELSTSISYGAHQMRDGVNLNQQRQVKPVVRSSDIMLLNDLEAYVKYPGNFPVAKIKFEYKKYAATSDIFHLRPAPINADTDSAHTDTKKDANAADCQNSSNEEIGGDDINVIHADFSSNKTKEVAKDKDGVSFTL